MNIDLSDRIAIVTGGSQGIGRAICTTLSEAGANVIVADIDAEKAAETVALLSTAGRVVQTDVSSEDSVLSLYQQVLAEEGRVDILVNNAGICRMIPILETTVEEWDRILGVNLRGTFLMSREALRIMKDQKSGRIISIASAAAKLGGLAAGAHYSASKAGVICLTKTLALQAAQYGINANAVCPGPMATEMTDAWGDDANTAFKAKIPFGDYGRPRHVADAVLFLASDMADYITGEILDVNGGLIMD